MKILSFLFFRTKTLFLSGQKRKIRPGHTHGQKHCFCPQSYLQKIHSRFSSLEKIFGREFTMAVVNNTNLYKLYDERTKLRTVGANEKLTPAEYKQRLDILYQW